MPFNIGRREAIAALGGAVAWPLGSRAQQPDRMRLIGVLISPAGNDKDARARIASFLEGLGNLGWSEHGNIRVDVRWGGLDEEARHRYAKEIVATHPDIVFTTDTPTTASILAETRIVPVVFVQVSDPVGSGFVSSFARPGGNVTGFSNLDGSMAGKWVEILKEIAPQFASAAFLYNPATMPFLEYYLDPFRTAARSLSVEPVILPLTRSMKNRAALTTNCLRSTT
jgi:putative tryptophan/tyrosine transport system substrate-binding protein